MPDRSAAVFSISMATVVVVLVSTDITGVKFFPVFSETMPTGTFGGAFTLTTGLITLFRGRVAQGASSGFATTIRP